MSGGKGGSQTTQVQVPQYIEDAAKASLAKADLLAQIGYTPYYGPDVAAFTPMQQAAFQSTSDAASAFGMGTPMSQQDVMGGMPAPTTYAGGVQGYSSAPMFEQSVDQLRQRRPGQYDALTAPFIDPVTGAAPAYPYTGSTGGDMPQDGMTPAFPSEAVNRRDYDDRGNGGGMGEGMGGPSGAASGGMFGGYSGFGDMTDGGGPGQSGSEFGGALGGISNAAGATPSGSGGGEGGGGDCVVATHAVSSGAFTPQTKREAVVWCMKALHGKWWGEAVRRGYRHLGTKKIEQGKAREHYEEFRRYIDFASGKKRTLKGALTFTLRTAQFFAVGLLKKGA